MFEREIVVSCNRKYIKVHKDFGLANLFALLNNEVKNKGLQKYLNKCLKSALLCMMSPMVFVIP